MSEYQYQMTVVIRDSHFGRRLFSLTVSALLHGCAIVLLSLLSVTAPMVVETPRITPDYSVRFLNLQSPLVYRGNVPGAEAARMGDGASSAPAQQKSRSGGESLTANAAPAAAGEPATAGEAAAPSQPAPKREYRQFQLPPTNRPQEARQTLVELDVPPEMQLKREIPLATVVLWTQPKIAPPKRQFVAPPKDQAHALQSLPAAVAIEPPNSEIAISNVNISASIINRTARFFHPPSVAPPVISRGDEPAVEIPQIGLANLSQPVPANILSLPNTPARSAALVGLPPANQIARQDIAGAGSMAGDLGAARGAQGSGSGAGSAIGGDAAGRGSQAGSSGTARPGGTGAAPSGPAGRSGNGSSTLAGIPGPGAGGGKNEGGASRDSSAGNGTLARGSNPGTGGRIGGAGSGGAGGTELAANGAGRGGTSTGLDAGVRLPGVSRIDLPKDGKFNVVVLGSADATRYPESIRALSGKILYTVYLRVGLRKNWILQYCLAKEPQGSASRKGSTPPLDAPWPYIIERPDRWSASDPDYIMVHGLITAAGKFDQLALVSPNDLEKKDLLLDSLKLWDFRPASRDGEPTAVEVLLIIPHEAE